jgi:anti-sigma factor ChrR (cupin superfamily)
MGENKVYTDLFDGGLHNGQFNWIPYVQLGYSAVEIERLYISDQTAPVGAEAYIARFKPGSYGDLHEHLGFEATLILAGELHDDNGDRYLAGTLIIESPGSVHQVSSPTGCVALVVRDRATKTVVADSPV